MALEKTMLKFMTPVSCGANDFMIVIKPNDPKFYRIKISNLRGQFQEYINSVPPFTNATLNNAFANEILEDYRNKTPYWCNGQSTVPAGQIYVYMFQSYEYVGSQGAITVNGTEIFRTTGSQDDTNSGLCPIFVADGKTIEWEGYTVVMRRRYL